MPVYVLVHASTVYEAALRAMDEIRKANGTASDLDVTMHEPKKEWRVSMERLKKYASTFGAGDNVGLKSVKRNVADFLAEKGK